MLMVKNQGTKHSLPFHVPRTLQAEYELLWQETGIHRILMLGMRW